MTVASIIITIIVIIALLCLLVITVAATSMVDDVVRDWSVSQGFKQRIDDAVVRVMRVPKSTSMICMAANPSNVIDDLGRSMNVSANPNDNTPALCRELINAINAGNFGWKAGESLYFQGLTIAEAAKRLGTWSEMTSTDDVATLQQRVAIPASFDARDKWPRCVHPIKNQGSCGSCWAFSVSTVLAERRCINGQTNTYVPLSVQYLLDKSTKQCNANGIVSSLKLLNSAGTPEERCYPYLSSQGHSNRRIPVVPRCSDGTRLTPYKGKSYTKLVKAVPKINGQRVSVQNVMRIQTEIMTNGPVVATMKVYTDLYAYVSGVYRRVIRNLAGGHAITILGWGVEAGTPYWLCSNTWSKDWGEDGYFKIRRGVNECDIESNVYSINL